MDAKLQDRQLKYVLKNYILPEKKFDFDEFRTQEEFNDYQEGLKNTLIFLKKSTWNYLLLLETVLTNYKQKADSIKEPALLLNEPQLLTRLSFEVSPVAMYPYPFERGWRIHT